MENTKREIDLLVKKLPHYDEEISLPNYQTVGSSGVDLHIHLLNRGELVIRPREKLLVPTGLAMEIPEGFEIQIRPRSGLSLKTGLMIVNAPGTIDSDYRGEIKIILGNLGDELERIKHGDRIAQAILSPVWRMNFRVVDDLSVTARASGGLGHTGMQGSQIN